jgi:CheY-like chemotaxis protein
LIVEDDDLQAEFLERLLHNKLPDHRTHRLKSEADFRAGLASGLVFQASVIVMDCLLPWDAASPGAATTGNRFTGGIRCIRGLRDQEPSPPIPVIFRSHIEAWDIAPHLETLSAVHIVGKSVDEDERLIELLSHLLH